MTTPTLDKLIALATDPRLPARALAVPTIARSDHYALILPPPYGGAKWRSAWGASIRQFLAMFEWKRGRWQGHELDDIVSAYLLFTYLIGHPPPLSDGARDYLELSHPIIIGKVVDIVKT